MTALLVALGAAVGAPLRLALGHWLRERYAATPTAGTLLVNVLGSGVLGWAAASGVSGSTMAWLGVGFCGALTTFSTLGLDLWEALEQRRLVHLATNLVLTLGLGVGAAALGWRLGS